MAAYYVSSSLEVIFILILLFMKVDYSLSKSPISNKRLCADKECKVVISKGRALATHPSGHPLILSFKRDDVVLITSKSAGDNTKLWGGEVYGKKGYFDKGFVRESKVFVAEPQYLVDTEVKLGKPPPAHLDKEVGRKPVEPEIEKKGIGQDKAPPDEAKVHIPEPRVPQAKEESQHPVSEASDEKDAVAVHESKEENFTKVESHSQEEGGKPREEGQSDVSSESESKQREKQIDTQKDESEEVEDFNKFVRKKFSSEAIQDDQTALKDISDEPSKDATNKLSQDAPDEMSKNRLDESSKDALEFSKDAPDETSKDEPDKASLDSPDESSEDAHDESSKDAPDKSSEDLKPSAETSQENIVPHPLRPTEHSRDKESTEGSDLIENEEDPVDAIENNLTDGNSNSEENNLLFQNEDKEISFKKPPKLKEADDQDTGGITMFAIDDEGDDSMGADLPMYDPNSPAAGDSRTGTDKTEIVDKLKSSQSGPSKLVSAGGREKPPTASVDQGVDQGKQDAEVEDGGGIANDDDEEQQDGDSDDWEKHDEKTDDSGKQVDVIDETGKNVNETNDSGKRVNVIDESGKNNKADELKEQNEKSKEIKSKISSFKTKSNAEIDAEHSKGVKGGLGDNDDGKKNKLNIDDLKDEIKLGHILKESQVFSHDDEEVALNKKVLELPKETISGESSHSKKVQSLSDKLKDESSSDTEFDVRPDTPSGESPEQAQVNDTTHVDQYTVSSSEKAQVKDTTHVDQDTVSSPEADNIQDGGHEEKSPEPNSDSSSEHSSSDKPSSNSPDEPNKELLQEIIEEPTDADGEPYDPVDLDHFKRDETRSFGGGFAGFLEASASEPQLTDHSSGTPELASLPTVSDSGESVANTGTSAQDIHSTSTRDHNKEETTDTEEDVKPLAAKGSIETIIEGESTILLDADGNYITAFMKEEPQTADQVRASESSLAVESVGSSQVSPTPVDSLPKPSVTSQASDEKVLEDNHETPLQSSRKEGSLNSSNPLSDLDSGGSVFLDGPVNEVYQSSDFSSRKVLSLNQQPPTAQQQQPPTAQQQKQASQETSPTLDTSKPIDVAKSRSEDLLKSEIVESLDDLLQGDAEIKEEIISSEEQPTHLKEEKTRDHLHVEQTESSTQSPEENPEIPPPPTFREPSSSDDLAGQEYVSESIYHSRKINDEELLTKEEEELTKASPGFAKSIMTSVEGCAKAVVDKLPPSLQSLLEMEPIGLSPNMTVMATFVSLILLVIISLTSSCSSNGKKQKLRATLDVIQELEAKLQIAVKEKENIEDKIKESQIENTKLKEEMSKQKKDSGKSNSELKTIQLHSESLEKQVAALEIELKELKENSNSKIGEAKQTSKKVKELEKNLKKIEEREKKLEQENHKLISNLRHKEEEVVSLTSKIGGLTEQIGHLETRKDQLLSEAEDWKEKVSDLNERLEQREEEFKQMQENIMFKDNELEVLKVCFLELKSFEEEEAEDGEDREDGSLRVQEKLNSMMDVSKVNAALRAIEEEKDILANRLKIESEARKELEEQLENSRRSVESSMADKMKAERQCQEAQTKLNVLSNYFKEKELQLQRELGEQEALKKQNLNKLVSADETTRSFQQELEIVRTQNESLKRELASSERDFRSQIAANEKKAHENWLAARAAERELKEARHEAGVMRQKLTDIERRQFMGPGGLIRPLPTRGMPPPGMMNGPPPPGMDRSPSRGSLPPLPPLHLRDEEFMNSSRSPMELRRGPLPPPGMRQHPDARSPPLPPFRDGRSPPPRMPPPGMLDGRSPPPYERRPPPPHMLDRRSPPFRLPPPDMLPPPSMRGGGPLPPPHFSRGSPSSGTDSPHLDRPDGRYPPAYARNPPFPSDRPSPRGGAPPRQQQSQV